ncbi:unnamed protein product [Chrysoparadoxa australica]
MLVRSDYEILAKGLRNPYRLTVDERTGDIYIGDVGSNLKEEINRLHFDDQAAGVVANFGWPCIEGVSDEPNDGDRMWIDTICDPDTMLCDLCEAIYPCAYSQPGTANCDPSYRPPVFSYRSDPIDPEYPLQCTSGSVATTGLAFFDGSFFREEGEALLPYNLIAADLGHACVWYFDNLADGRPDFQAPHLLTYNHAPTSLIQGPDGYLYSTEINTVFRHSVVSKAPPIASLILVYDGTVCNDPCQVPTASATITLDASASTPGLMSGETIIEYQWTFGDGTQDVTTAPVTTHEYDARGTYAVELTVLDSNDKTGSAGITLITGAVLDVTFDPPSGAWGVGDRIDFTLSFTGFGGNLRTENWNLGVAHCVYNECTQEDDCHFHTGSFLSVRNRSGSFTAVSHDLPSFVELTGTFSVNGIVFEKVWSTTSRIVQATQLSLPESSFMFSSGQGEECISPCNLEVMSGRTIDFFAPEYQAAFDNIYHFKRWEVTPEGEATDTYTDQLVDILLPVDTTLVAVYEQMDPVTISLPPPVLLGVSGFFKHIEILWYLEPETRAMCDEVVAAIAPLTGGAVMVQTGVVASSSQNSARAKVPAGEFSYSVQLVCHGTEFNEVTAGSTILEVTSSADPALECYPEPGPFNGSPWIIPTTGSIDFELYDQGGPGLAYYDSNALNQAGSQIRGDTGVDIAPCPQCDGGNAVEWVADNEWLQFTVQVMYSGDFTVVVDTAAAGGLDKKKGVYFMLNQPCNEAEAVASVEEDGGTGGWGNYVSMSQSGVFFPAGIHIMR